MILLDWRAMKYYWPRAFLVPVFVVVMGIMSPACVLPLGVLLCLAYSVNPFAMEEKGQLDNLYLTLPVSRKTIVTARYAFSLTMQFFAFLFGVPVMYLIARMRNNTQNHFGNVYFGMDGKMILLIAALSFLCYALINLCMFPVLFKIGYSKGKAIGYYIPMLFFIGLAYAAVIMLSVSDTLINTGLLWLNWAVGHTGALALCILLTGMLFLGISYLLSLHFYRKREF